MYIPYVLNYEMYSPYTDVKVCCNDLHRQMSVASYSCFHSCNIGRRCSHTRSCWPRQISCWLSTLAKLRSPVIHSCFGHTCISIYCLHFVIDRHWLTAFCTQKLNYSTLILFGRMQNDTSFFHSIPHTCLQLQRNCRERGIMYHLWY